MPHTHTAAAPGPDGNATPAWPARMARSALQRYATTAMRWHYEDGLLLRALAEVGAQGGPAECRQAAAKYADHFVGPGGAIRTYRLDEYNLDQILPGRLLFDAYRETEEERYGQALSLLRDQLRRQPRTTEGGFWHKLIYPHQMWLDGIYMAGPFLAQYGAEFAEAAAFDEAARQILLIARHTQNSRSGLLYHGWDESREQRWTDPLTGCSPNFWGRAVGWYLMAIVDVLDFLPPDHAQRSAIIGVFARTAGAVSRVQDAQSGLWYQVLDQGGQPGNYLEASASCMFVYSLAKGARRGYVGSEYWAVAQRGFQGILTRLVTVEPNGAVHLQGICGTAGLGGTPYRDGSFEYYVGERVVANDYKGVGPFMLAALEMERRVEAGQA